MKIFIVILLLISSYTLSAQDRPRIGIILKDHPTIDLVKKLFEYIGKGDTSSMKKIYADTAKFYTASEIPFGKTYSSLNQVIKSWSAIYSEWDSIRVHIIENPEAFVYNKGEFRVQSLWEISGKNHITHKSATYLELVFSEFNRDGKIIKETSFLDSSQILNALKD